MTDEQQNNQTTAEKVAEIVQEITEVNGVPLIQNPIKSHKKQGHWLRGRKKLMAEALVNNLGIITKATKEVGIDYTTHYEWLKTDPIYKEACEKADIKLKDTGEAVLLELLIEKNPSVAIHFAKTKLRDRGYAEKIELEHTGNMGVTFNLIEKPLEEIKNARPNNNTQTEGTAQSP